MIHSPTPKPDPTLQFMRDFRNRYASKIERRTEVDFATFAVRRLKIQNKDSEIVPFRLNCIQRRYLEMKKAAINAGRPRRFLVLKYRQGGITTIEQGLSYRSVVTRENTRCLTLSYDADHTEIIFGMALMMHELDPQQLARKTENSKLLHYPALNTKYRIATAGGKRAGRGWTLERVHGSEVAWWFEGRNQQRKQERLISGFGQAAKRGEIVLETTPNGSEWFHKTYMEAKEKGTRAAWVPIFLPWFFDHENNSAPFTSEADAAELIDTLNEEELHLMQAHGCTHEMINWRRKTQGELDVLFPQEYPEDDESCFLMSGTCWFNVKVLTKLLSEVRATQPKEIPNGYIDIWEEPIDSVSYTAGGDTSEGLPNSEKNGMGIIRNDTGAQVAAIHGRLPPDQLAEEGCKLARRYNTARLAWERNNHGHAVIQKSVSLHYPNLFKADDGKLGWLTNKITRPLLLNEIREIVNKEMTTIRDRKLLSECLMFRRQSDGGYEHEYGHFDDRIFKWGIAYKVRAMRPIITGDIMIAKPKRPNF